MRTGRPTCRETFSSVRDSGFGDLRTAGWTLWPDVLTVFGKPTIILI